MNSTDSTFILETARLRLRKMKPEDATALLESLGDPEVMYHYPEVLNREGVESWIGRNLARYEKDGIGSWICELKSSGEIVGQCGLIRQDLGGGLFDTGLIYLLNRRHWHQGFCTEAAQGCIEYASRELNLPRVIATIRPINYPSANVAKRLGMNIEKMVIYWDCVHDVWVKGR